MFSKIKKLFTKNKNLAVEKENQQLFFSEEDFIGCFGAEMDSAVDVFKSMKRNGLKEYMFLEFDFHFISDEMIKLQKLMDFLSKHYLYEYEAIYQTEDGLWELTGKTNEFPVTADNLMFWSLDMYKRGHEFDARLDGYGASVEIEDVKFPDFHLAKEDYYFDLAMDRYNAGDLSGAIINWSNILNIKDDSDQLGLMDVFYSLAVVKAELHTWKAAIRDYDKAIMIAPDFVNALTNRGALKDDNGDHEGAIEDYNLVIKMKGLEVTKQQQVFYNRGNSYHNIGQQMEACADWKRAYELGAEYALERFENFCENGVSIHNDCK